jgi:hypothetical protein
MLYLARGSEILQAKLDKAVVLEVTFVVDPKSFNKPMNRNINLFKRRTNAKENLSITKFTIVIVILLVTIVVTKDISLQNVTLGNFWFLRAWLNGFPSTTIIILIQKDPNDIFITDKYFVSSR